MPPSIPHLNPLPEGEGMKNLSQRARRERGNIEVIEPGIALRLESLALEPWKVWAIAVSAKDQVDSAVALILTEEGIGVLPNDLALGGDFEEAARRPFADKRVAIGQALGAADKKAIKLPSRPRLVLPDDGIGFGIHLKDARLHPGSHSMETIIEEEDVAIRQGIRVMLMPQFVPPPFPAEV